MSLSGKRAVGRRLRSLRFDVGAPDDLAPLLSFFGDVLAEVGGRAPKDHSAQLGKTCLDLGVGKIVDDLGRRPLRCRDANPGARLKAWHRFPQCRNIDRASERVAVVTASGRNLPDLMCSIDAGKLSNATCT